MTKPHTHIVSRIGGWIALVVSILGVGMYNALGKNLSGSLSPYAILLASELVMAALVLVAFGAVPTFQDIKKLSKKTLKYSIIVATASSVIGPIFWLEGIQLSSATNASLFAGVDIVCTMILASVWLRQRFHPEQIAGAFVVCIGIAFAFLVSCSRTGLSFGLGDALLFLGTASTSVGNVVFRKYLSHCNPRVFLSVRIITCIVILTAIAPFLTGSLAEEILNMPTVLILTLITFGVVGRFVSMYGYYTAIERLPITTVSLCGSSTVIIGLFFAYVLAGEAIAWYHIVGATLIMSGMALFEWPHKPVQWHPLPVPMKSAHH